MGAYSRGGRLFEGWALIRGVGAYSRGGRLFEGWALIRGETYSIILSPGLHLLEGGPYLWGALIGDM